MNLKEKKKPHTHTHANITKYIIYLRFVFCCNFWVSKVIIMLPHIVNPTRDDHEDDQQIVSLPAPQIRHNSPLNSLNISSPCTNKDDVDILSPTTRIGKFFSAFCKESKRLWCLAGPAIFTSICQYSLGAVTQTFAGHVGRLELAAFSIENSVIAGLSYGVMVGMSSAFGTLCGQAYGAGQTEMLGIYMQRSWIILLSTSLLLTLLYIFATPFLLLIKQENDIARAAGRLALWMIPQLYAYAVNFPTARFLMAQNKIMVLACISAAGLAFHIALSWLLMLKLQWGMAGGAAVLNASWLFITAAQLIYIWSGRCGNAWSGFSWKAFNNLLGFARVLLASTLMLCLESWYFMALIILAGYQKNAEVSVDAISICTNILGWTNGLAVGITSAVSVRVSNELGANRPRWAKFSVLVVVITSFMIGLLISAILLICRGQYPSIFIDKTEVIRLVYNLTPLLAFSVIVNIIQLALSGVAVGAGWQALVGYVNIMCYYVFGIPLGLILGYKFKLGVQGIWYGMVAGTSVQMLALVLLIYRTNWNKEAGVAAERVKQWGGVTEEDKQNNIES